MAEGHRQRDVMFSKLDAIAESVQQSITHHHFIVREVETIKKKLLEIQPVIDDMTNLKQRGLGALAVVGLGAGGVSAMLVKIGYFFTGQP